MSTEGNSARRSHFPKLAPSAWGAAVIAFVRIHTQMYPFDKTTHPNAPTGCDNLIAAIPRTPSLKSRACYHQLRYNILHLHQTQSTRRFDEYTAQSFPKMANGKASNRPLSKRHGPPQPRHAASSHIAPPASQTTFPLPLREKTVLHPCRERFPRHHSKASCRSTLICPELAQIPRLAVTNHKP